MEEQAYDVLKQLKLEADWRGTKNIVYRADALNAANQSGAPLGNNPFRYLIEHGYLQEIRNSRLDKNYAAITPL